MSDLAKKTCKPVSKQDPALHADEIANFLKQVNQHWQLHAENTALISREFKFKNYYETMAFVNAIAYIAHKEDHHPDIEVSYSKCLVKYSTHAITGLSENDFICAAKIDELVE